MAWLGVDMGGTASRWVLVDDAGAVARGAAPGATALRADAAQRAGFEAALDAIRSALPRPPRAACLGLTGAGHAPGAALVAACAGPLGLATDKVRVMNDVQLAWHAAFPGGGAGHLVLAGTGSVGLGRSAGGGWVEVGGRGALIDDAGSAVWIVLRALDLVYRRIDESGRPAGCEALADALFTILGARDWDSVCARVHAMARGELGALAVAVMDAARAGDAAAQALLGRAADELARLARALAARCGPAPLVLAGGVLAPDGGVRHRLAAMLADRAPRFQALDAAAAGARLAMEGEKA